MALSLTPSSAESCFGVIGSVIFRTIISSANVGPINPLTRRNPRQLQLASYRRVPASRLGPHGGARCGPLVKPSHSIREDERDSSSPVRCSE